MSHVKIVKFLSDREIIAKIVDEGKTTITVQSPLAIQPMRSGEASMALGMMPFTWAGSNREPITLNRDHILCIMTPESDLETQYLAALSGIALPQGPSSKITLTEA
jgi:hypothetical protein